MRVIGLTIGDPAGIGTEIIKKVLRHFKNKKNAPRLRIIGSSEGIRPGKPTLASAQRALEALETSVALLKTGEIQAVVNAPVCKKTLHQIGFRFPGQTEFYAAQFGLKPHDVTMMLACDKLRVALVTTHCSLKKGIHQLTTPKIIQTTERTIQTLKKLGIRKPRIAVCGLNPHAGENGLFGDEEEKFILPAVKKFKKNKTAIVSGVYPPDTVFLQAVRGHFDAVVCMVHDHGLIPLKLVGFESGVNLTAGLPFPRTSPDHGTAFDIAGKSKASASSLIHAIELAQKLLH